MTATTTPVETRTLRVPGATLTYDVRPNPDSTEAPLLLIGSPMGAGGFGTLAKAFEDRTVITYDPRGVERSVKDDVKSPVSPDIHADDIHAVIQAVGGPVDLFASSGGAVNALALVARYPGDVRTAVAHEPPLASIVEDRDEALAAVKRLSALYHEKGFGAGMASFIATVAHVGPFTPETAASLQPDPAMFGMPTEDDGSRDDVLLGQNLISITHYEPQVDALKASDTRIVMAAGEGGVGTLANRGAHAVAALLGTDAVTFPGDHAGFLGGEYGQMGEPDAFAARLRDVLAGTS